MLVDKIMATLITCPNVLVAMIKLRSLRIAFFEAYAASVLELCEVEIVVINCGFLWSCHLHDVA